MKRDGLLKFREDYELMFREPLNAFVNFDVPSHSLVIGNPGVIHHKDGATKDYFVETTLK